jgi:predicted DsbA family dithiol-disulfide isomerase
MPGARTALILLPVFLASTAAAQETGARADMELIGHVDAARTIGPGSAVVSITEFIDFACPDCRGFHLNRADSLQALVEEEGIRFSLRVFPIPRLMRGYHAAEAAFCAAAYGGRPAFLGMVDRLFERQSEWRFLIDPTRMFEWYAEEVGVPMPEYRNCVGRDAMAPLIIHDIRMAKDAGVGGTPSFVFTREDEWNGDEVFYGSQPMSTFKESIRKVEER